MDSTTRAIYEQAASEWEQRRRPRDLDSAHALAARSVGPSIDLGCGPGWYAGELAPPVVAFDGAHAMLRLVPGHAPAAQRVQGDLEALPFARASFAAAWARNSYVHLSRTAMPLALAELHRILTVGGKATLWFFAGDGEGRDLFEGDDFPGRFFSMWGDELLDVIGGGGFTVARGGRSREAIEIEVTRDRTLPDIVAPGMRVLVCGLNPSLYAADAGVGFARPGNRFWPAALASGLVTVDRDPLHALRHHGIGFTDIVKRATVRAAELGREEYRNGFGRLERTAAWLQPKVVAFVGLAGWRAAVDGKAGPGLQDRRVGGRPAYVLPSSSGLNAHSSVQSLADHLQRAASVA